LNLEVIAFMFPKPATPVAVIAASVPPAIMTSAAPRRRISRLSPSAWAPVAHAVTTVELGPFAPVRMEICPDAMSAIIIGMRSGETRGTVLDQIADLFLERGQTTNARSHQNTDPFRV